MEFFLNRSGINLIAALVLSSCLYGNGDFIPANIKNQVEKRFGLFASKRVAYLNEKLKEAKNKNILEKLRLVNNFWNDLRYGKDIVVYGKRDYWATPLQFIDRDRGDCEDYAIAKYFSLKYLGVDTKKLFFVYCVVKKRNIPHMVLAYYKTSNSEPLILDSINYKIFPASKREDIVPIYTFNGDILKKFRNKSKKIRNFKRKNAKVRLKWDDLLNRIKRNVL